MKNWLRVLRAERAWSQAELARQLRVSRQTVNAIETGKFDPSLPLAFRIATLFDQPIEEIFEPGGHPTDLRTEPCQREPQGPYKEATSAPRDILIVWPF